MSEVDVRMPWFCSTRMEIESAAMNRYIEDFDT